MHSAIIQEMCPSFSAFVFLFASSMALLQGLTEEKGLKDEDFVNIFLWYR